VVGRRGVRDPGQPGAEALVVPKARAVLPDPEENVLNDVFHVRPGGKTASHETAHV
jgi:hypothetical protein